MVAQNQIIIISIQKLKTICDSLKIGVQLPDLVEKKTIYSSVIDW